MTRSVDEWIGKTDDTPIPPRVRLRVFERAKGRCEICDRKLGPADTWEADHTVALCNGGDNREGNLRVACSWCHASKTKADVSIKSKSARVRARHLGVKKSSRPMPGSKASPWKRTFSGEVVRREEV